MVRRGAHLSVVECEKLYSDRSGYEYWFGEARQKPLPTYLHGLLQPVLTHLCLLAGYGSSAEVELRSDPDWHPRPDVVGVAGEMEECYLTQPVDVVFEVLSEGEEDIEKKCNEYSESVSLRSLCSTRSSGKSQSGMVPLSST